MGDRNRLAMAEPDLDRGPGDREEGPLARDALELVDPALVEPKSGTDDEVTQRLGDDNFARSREVADASPDVDGDATHVVAAYFAFAGVQAGPDLEPEWLYRVANRDRAPDRSLRPVERGEKAVARGAHLATAVAHQLGSDHRIVCVQQRTPVPVAHLRGSTRRIDDVREQHRG